MTSEQSFVRFRASLVRVVQAAGAASAWSDLRQERKKVFEDLGFHHTFQDDYTSPGDPQPRDYLLKLRNGQSELRLNDSYHWLQDERTCLWSRRKQRRQENLHSLELTGDPLSVPEAGERLRQWYLSKGYHLIQQMEYISMQRSGEHETSSL